MVTIYGIKNCDTMKKAFNWLDDHGVNYQFHDYKKNDADSDILDRAIAQFGWETVINRKGMTWRQLPESIKESINENTALELAMEKPSVIKRPILANGDILLIGFDLEKYKIKLSKGSS